MDSLPTLIDDLAPDRQEWIESLDAIHREYGDAGVLDILRGLQNHVLAKGIVLSEATLNTPYINSIPVSEQPVYPGDIEMEERIENIIRWNAMAMVLRGQDEGTGIQPQFFELLTQTAHLEIDFLDHVAIQAAS